MFGTAALSDAFVRSAVYKSSYLLTSVGQRSFAFHGSTVWNGLPSALSTASQQLVTEHVSASVEDPSVWTVTPPGARCGDFLRILAPNIIFTALHGMQTRSSDENSVSLSVTRVYCDETVERSVQIYIPYE